MIRRLIILLLIVGCEGTTNTKEIELSTWECSINYDLPCNYDNENTSNDELFQFCPGWSECDSIYNNDSESLILIPVPPKDSLTLEECEIFCNDTLYDILSNYCYVRECIESL